MNQLIKTKKFNIILSTILGNIMEAYDFIIFGFMLKYIQEIFLPTYQDSTKYILAFLLFSIGYLGRPLGAYMLGILGDLKGRRASIAVSILILTISTASIGLLPTYKQTGVFAPILLIVLRLAQNFSVSVEQVGGSLFLIESFSKKYQYFVSSCMFGSVYLGHIIGLAIVLLLISNLSIDEIITWGWRIPFLLALPLGLFTLYLRLKLNESPEFLNKIVIRKKIKIDKDELILIISSFLSLAGSAYLTVIYIPNMLHIDKSLSSLEVFWYAAMVNFIVFCVALISGVLSDKQIVNGVVLQRAGLRGNILFALPIYWLLDQGNLLCIITAQIIAAVLLGIQAGTILGAIYSNYKEENKYLTINLGFNIAMTFFGGLSPFIAAYLASSINSLAPAIYLILLSSITLLSISDKIILNKKIMWIKTN